MVAALAFTKRLDREANLGLQAELPRTAWARMVVDEVFADHPKQVTGDPRLALRKARGITRHHYNVLSPTDDELRTELACR